MIADACNWPRGVTVSTLDSESSDRGSNPREALNPSVAPHVEVRAECKCPVWARVSLTAPFAVQGPTRTYGRRTSLSDTARVCDATRRVRPFAQLNLEGHGGVASTAPSRALGRRARCGGRRGDLRCSVCARSCIAVAATHGTVRSALRKFPCCATSVHTTMTLAGLEPAIFGSEDQRLIH